MNISISHPKPTINNEAAQLLAILRDCGIDSVWQDPETRLLSFYLRNTLETTSDIRSEIGSNTYGHFVRQVSRLRQHQYIGPGKDIRHWFLRYADPRLLKEALQTSARENLNKPAVTVTYNEQHPGFSQDHADFEKLMTLYMLDSFPRQIWYNHDLLVNRLNYYEYFRHRHGDTSLLNAFRQSIMRHEAKNLAGAIKYSSRNGKKPRAKTVCLRRYLNMTSYNRLRVIRYYQYTLAQQKAEDAQ